MCSGSGSAGMGDFLVGKKRVDHKFWVISWYDACPRLRETNRNCENYGVCQEGFRRQREKSGIVREEHSKRQKLSYFYLMHVLVYL